MASPNLHRSRDPSAVGGKEQSQIYRMWSANHDVSKSLMSLPGGHGG